MNDNTQYNLTGSSSTFSFGPPSLRSTEEKLWFDLERKGMGNFFSTLELEILCDILNEVFGRDVYTEIDEEELARMWNDTHFVAFCENFSINMIPFKKLKVYKRPNL